MGGVTRLTIHLGLPRTATSRLQQALREDRERLAEQGIRALLPPMVGRRNDLGLREVSRHLERAALRRSPLGRWRARRAARSAFSGMSTGTARHLILSEENFVTPIWSPRERGLLPEAGRKLDELARLLRRTGAPAPRVVLSLRGYDEFLVSSYAMMTVYAGRRNGFAEVLARVGDMRGAYPRLLTAIRDRLDPGEMVLATHEGTPFAAIYEAMTGLAPPPASDKGRVNPRPDAALIEAMLAGKHDALDRTGLDRLMAQAGEDGLFDPLESDRKARLRADYAADLATCRAMPGVIAI